MSTEKLIIEVMQNPKSAYDCLNGNYCYIQNKKMNKLIYNKEVSKTCNLQEMNDKEIKQCGMIKDEIKNNNTKMIKSHSENKVNGTCKPIKIIRAKSQGKNVDLENKPTKALGNDKIKIGPLVLNYERKKEYLNYDRFGKGINTRLFSLPKIDDRYLYRNYDLKRNSLTPRRIKLNEKGSFQGDRVKHEKREYKMYDYKPKLKPIIQEDEGSMFEFQEITDYDDEFDVFIEEEEDKYKDFRESLLRIPPTQVRQELFKIKDTKVKFSEDLEIIPNKLLYKGLFLEVRLGQRNFLDEQYVELKEENVFELIKVFKNDLCMSELLENVVLYTSEFTAVCSTVDIMTYVLKGIPKDHELLSEVLSKVPHRMFSIYPIISEAIKNINGKQLEDYFLVAQVFGIEKTTQHLNSTMDDAKEVIFETAKQAQQTLFEINATVKEAMKEFVDMKTKLGTDQGLLVGEIENASKSFQNLMDKMSAVVDRVAPPEILKADLTKIPSMYEKATDLAKGGYSLIDKYISVRYIIMNSDVPYWIRFTKAMEMLVSMVINCFKLVMNAEDVLTFVYQYLNINDFNRENLIEAQSDNLIQTGLIALLTSGILGMIPNRKTVDGIVHFFARFNTFSTSIKKLEDIFPGLANCLGRWSEAISAYFSTNKLLNWLFENDKPTKKLFKDYIERSMLYLETDEDLVGDDEELDKILTDIYNDGKKIQSLVVINGWTKETIQLKDITKKIDNRMALLKSKRCSFGGRVTPYCIAIAGESQIGKSQLLTEMVTYLLPNVPPSKRIYARGSTAHYDGYNGQEAIIFDDYCARTETDYGELLDLVTCNPTRLPMASVDDPMVGKKGTMFTSKLMVLSTNVPYPSCDNTMNYAKAVYKRRHMLVEVKKIMSEYREDGSHLEFRLLNPVYNTGSNYMDDKTYSKFQIFDLMKSNFDKHMAMEEILLNKRINILKLKDYEKEYKKEQIIIDEKIETTRDKRMTHFGKLMAQGCPDVFYDASEEKVDIGSVIIEDGITDTLRYKANRIKQFTFDIFESIIADSAKLGAVVVGVSSMIVLLVSVVSMISEFRKEKSKSLLVEVEDMGNKLDWDDEKKAKLVTFMANVDSEAKGYDIRTPGAKRTNVVIREHVLRSKPIVEEAKGYDIRAPGTLRANRTVKPKTLNRHPLVEQESTADQSAAQVVNLLINQSVVDLKFVDDITGRSNTVRGICIGGKHILTVGHLFNFDNNENIEGNLIVTKAKAVGEPCIYQGKITENEVAICSGYDAAVIYFEPMTACRKITHLFVTDEDISNFKGRFEAELLTNRYIYNCDVTLNANPIRYGTGNNQNVSIAESWKYRGNTQAGDCGSALVHYESSIPRKIIGMHVAGMTATSICYSTIVTQELLELLVSGTAQCMVELPNIKFVEGQDMELEGSLSFRGKIESKFAIRTPTATKLIHSPIHSVFKHEDKQPAPLSNYDSRMNEPLELALTKLNLFNRPITEKPNGLQQAVDYLIEEFNDIDQEYPKVILTDSEILNGFDKLGRLNPNTSAGYPYQLYSVKKENRKGKLAYLTLNDENVWIMSDDYPLEAMKDREYLYSMNQLYPTIWTAQLKDELRSIEKIKKGDTRLFFSCPLDLTMLFRKYFGSFSSFITKNSISAGIAIGLDPESYQWNEVAQRLLKNSLFIGEDAKTYDVSLQPWMLHAAVDVVNGWYGDDNGKIRHQMIDEVLEMDILHEDHVFRKSNGGPSGWQLTALVNSLVRRLLFLCYLFDKSRPVTLRSPTFIKKNHYQITLGDDSAASVSQNLQFNLQDYQQMMTQWGMTITAADKTDLKWESFEDLTFLKRKFRKERNLYFSDIDENTLRNMVCWLRKSSHQTIDESLEMNIQMSLRFAFFKGKKFFDSFRNELKKALSIVNFSMMMLTYTELNDQYLENTTTGTLNFEIDYL